MRRPVKHLLRVPVLVVAFGVSLPAAGLAQPHGHPGGGHGGGAVVVAAPYYPFGFGFGWGYSPWWPYPYYPYPYPYPYYSVDPGGSLKLEIKPRQAEVYVDGYYAGIVDNFDGTFQRLKTTPGEHEIILYLDGYRTVHQKLYVQPSTTTKLKYEMEKLPAGEQAEERPQPPNPPPDQNPPQQFQGQTPPPRGQQYPPPSMPPQGPPQQGPRPGQGTRIEANGYGTLAVRVQPENADVMVDGERWSGPQGQERLFIEVPEGRHTVEIRKSGFRTYVTEIDVRHGETASLNVSLRTQEEQ